MHITIHPDIQKALANKQPIVALESTIIAFGMPYPDNFLTALRVEQTIRDSGAIPATVAIINGVCTIGLSKKEIQLLAMASDVKKVSRRDIPFVIANKQHGATTVSATMILASMAHIPVFVTGGIGGVHRGASQSFDISADLQELATTNMAVVCAGPKAILDLELTLEYLETMGVPVLGYQTDELPAFYTPHSGIKLEYRVESAQEIASIMQAKWEMGLKGAVLITLPISQEHALDPLVLYPAIDEALALAKTQHIKGKELTPFLLKTIQEKTTGESLSSNIQLILQNARLGAKIAQAYQHLQNHQKSTT